MEVMDIQYQLRIIADIALAMALGGLIGLERELAGKPAGLRTHILVAGVAALLIPLGRSLMEQVESAAMSGIGSDPTRIIHAIITGISILGAGTIVRQAGNDQIGGLTTAASILMAGTVGIAVAQHHYILGVGVAVLTLIVLGALRGLEKILTGKNSKENI